MAAMEHAIGASSLFDAGSQVVAKFADLHTFLGEQAADIIRCFNEREAREAAEANQIAGEEPDEQPKP